GAHADKAQSSGTSQSANDAKIQQLEQDMQDLSAQVQDLKRSSSDQYADLQAQQQKNAGGKFSIKNGRPTFTDGDFTFAIRSLIQYDTAYYGQGQLPSGKDFSSGNNFRRARLGFDGAYGDW